MGRCRSLMQQPEGYMNTIKLGEGRLRRETVEGCPLFVERRGPSLQASAALFLTLIAGGSAWCQTYPAKSVRLIIGGLPGTAPDVIARVMAPHITEALGQALV